LSDLSLCPSPRRGWFVSRFRPRLAPWAAILRRFAADGFDHLSAQQLEGADRQAGWAFVAAALGYDFAGAVLVVGAGHLAPGFAILLPGRCASPVGIEEQGLLPYELLYRNDVPQIFGHAVGHEEINVSLGVGHPLVAGNLDQVPAVGTAAPRYWPRLNLPAYSLARATLISTQKCETLAISGISTRSVGLPFVGMSVGRCVGDWFPGLSPRFVPRFSSYFHLIFTAARGIVLSNFQREDFAKGRRIWIPFPSVILALLPREVWPPCAARCGLVASR